MIISTKFEVDMTLQSYSVFAVYTLRDLDTLTF